MSDIQKESIKEIMYLAAEFGDNMNSELFQLISMSSICRIFHTKRLFNVVGGILSLYALMNGTLLEDEEFRNSLLDKGLKLNGFKIRSKSDLSNCIKFEDPEVNRKFFHYLGSENLCNDDAPIRIARVSYIFKERFSSLNFPLGLIVAFTGLCLCLMSKKLTKYNHFSWVRERWRGFLGIVGLDQHQFAEFGPSYHLMPGLIACINVHLFFKRNHEFRRRLYLGIMKLSWEPGLWGNMCRAVLRFSKELEMSHIALINTYILQDHPELTLVEELKPEFRKLQTAFQVFRNKNIPEEQWPYIQIMSKFSNDVWSSEKYPILTYLSVQIGKLIRANLDGYHCELSSEMEVIANRIMSDIINLDFAFHAVQAVPENGSRDIALSPNARDAEFLELFQISDILEKALYSVSGVRNFNEDDADLILIPNTIPSIEIKYFKISKVIGDESFMIGCLLNIFRIYQDDCLAEVIGGILSLFAAVGFSGTVFYKNCKKSLKPDGFELREIFLESANDLASQFIFENDELNDLFLKFINADRADDFRLSSVIIKRNSVVCQLFENVFLKRYVPDIFAYIGTYLLPIFKQLNETKYEGWFKHKWRPFTDPSSGPSCSELLLPPLNTCYRINSFFHSNFELRRILFLKSYEFANFSDSASDVFFVICQIAKQFEMIHIQLINYFILQKEKYLLKMKELKPELLRFMRALENVGCKMSSISCWSYIKLIAHPNEVEFLNKNHFPLLLYVAESIRDDVSNNYSGVREVTEYFEKVGETTKIFRKLYHLALNVKRIQKLFDLDFPNGDLLSSLKDEQLKELAINSALFSYCHDYEFGIIPEKERKEILDMSMEEAKKEYEHFKLPTKVSQRFQRVLDRLHKIENPSAVEAAPGSSGANSRNH